MIPDKAVDKFIELYRLEFGEDISRADAIEMATRLLNAVRAIRQPISTYHEEKISLLSAHQWNFEQIQKSRQKHER